ncbi:MAG: glycosyl transferase [Patescibacteria group bacterium]|nr:MAG: glycosyl transferase [Patescibacteria group bacterium]
MKKALIILPTYNEAGNIKTLIEKIFHQQEKLDKWSLEILVNDSQSTDETAKIVKQLQKKYQKLYLIETKKQGLGKAYYEGFLFAKENIKPYVVFEMDADLSHNPKNISQMLKEIENGADLVIGSRYIKGGSIPKNWGLHRKILSFFGNLIIRIGFMNLKIHDWTSGYRTIKFWILNNSLEHIKNYSGYVFQIALLDFAIKSKANIKEIPINFVDRKYGQSKIFFLQYIFSIFLYILKFSSFVKFVIVGVIGFIVDFGLMYLFINKIKIPSSKTWFAQAIAAETAIINNFLLNNFWSFQYKKLKNNLFFGFLKFNFISLGSILIQTFGLQIAVNIFGQQYWAISKIFIIILIIIPYSYIFYNHFVWKK